MIQPSEALSVSYWLYRQISQQRKERAGNGIIIKYKKSYWRNERNIRAEISAQSR
jgi:hypothetical protein